MWQCKLAVLWGNKCLAVSCVSFVWFLKPSWPLSPNTSSLIRLFWKTKISSHWAKVLNFTNRLSLFSVALRKIGDAVHIWYELDWLDIYVALSPLLTVITFDWTFGPFAPGIKVRFRWSDPNRIAFDHIEYTLWSDHWNHIWIWSGTALTMQLSQERLWQKLFLSYQVLCCGFLSWFLFCFTLWFYDLVTQFNEQYPMNCSTALHLKSLISLPKSSLSPSLFLCGCFKTLFSILFLISNPYYHPLLWECLKIRQME